jgi:hypothetical protein
MLLCSNGTGLHCDGIAWREYVTENNSFLQMKEAHYLNSIGLEEPVASTPLNTTVPE